MANANFADVNGQHVFYGVHGAGKPLILLHGGINPDSFGSNLPAPTSHCRPPSAIRRWSTGSCSCPGR